MNEKVEEKKVVSRETIRRLVKDVRDIVKQPLHEHGIYYHHDEEDMMKGYAMIVGPEDTPYFGGFYFFELAYPGDYPHTPPVATYCTNAENIRFNPNLYKCGKVCISLLNTWRGEQWTSCQSISTILLTLCTLLNREPLLNEPGISEKHRDFDNYHKIIAFKNVEIAMLDVLQKNPRTYNNTKFDVFDEHVHRHFSSNVTKVKEFLEKKKKSEPLQRVTTSLYKMEYCIDYKKLLEHFTEVVKKYKAK